MFFWYVFKRWLQLSCCFLIGFHTWENIDLFFVHPWVSWLSNRKSPRGKLQVSEPRESCGSDMAWEKQKSSLSEWCQTWWVTWLGGGNYLVPISPWLVDSFVFASKLMLDRVWKYNWTHFKNHLVVGLPGDSSFFLWQVCVLVLLSCGSICTYYVCIPSLEDEFAWGQASCQVLY